MYKNSIGGVTLRIPTVLGLRPRPCRYAKWHRFAMPLGIKSDSSNPRNQYRCGPVKLRRNLEAVPVQTTKFRIRPPAPSAHPVGAVFVPTPVRTVAAPRNTSPNVTSAVIRGSCMSIAVHVAGRNRIVPERVWLRLVACRKFTSYKQRCRNYMGTVAPR